jgi:hypothetical protein
MILQRCVERPLGAPREQGWKTIAFDVSETGLGITLPTELAEGTELEIEAWELSKAEPLYVRVIRSKRVDCVWLTGCKSVTRLSDDNLRAWMSGPQDWVVAN